MLILRSIPLSVLVYWRMLVVLPLVLPLASFTILVMMMIEPLVAIFLLVLVSVFLSLIGFRAGFQALGMAGPPVFDRLLAWTIIWSLLALMVYATLGVGVAIVLAALSLFRPPQYFVFIWNQQGTAFLDLLEVDPTLAVIAAVFLLLFVGVTVAVMVPMAAAAHSLSEREPQREILWGFGASFFSIAFVTLSAMAISTFSGAQKATLELINTGFEFAWAWMSQADLPEHERDEILPLVGYLFLEIWTYCWVFAAVALAVRARLAQEKSAAQKAAEDAPKATPVDLRALRQSRSAGPTRRRRR